VIAGALAWRALVAELLGLSALLPNIGLEQLLRDWDVGLLAVMALSAGVARRWFWIALAAVALGLGLDAVTPSYDAGAGWSWASLALEAVSAIALLWGLFLLGRFNAALVAVGILLGIVARSQELALGFSVAASLLQAVGYFLISRRVRTQTTPSTAKNHGLLRWSIIEIVRFVFISAFMVFWVDRRDELRPLLALAVIAFAVLTFIGLRWLSRFIDGAAPIGWGTVTLVAALLALFPIAESYLSGRLDALEYIRFAALAAAIAWLGGALSMLRLIARAAQGRLAWSARNLRRAILIDVLVLLAGAATEAKAFVPSATLALLALWLLYLILQLVAGIKSESFSDPR